MPHGLWIVTTGPMLEEPMVACSPYLLRPVRTLLQACRDVAAAHPELPIRECRLCAHVSLCALYRQRQLRAKPKRTPERRTAVVSLTTDKVFSGTCEVAT